MRTADGGLHKAMMTCNDEVQGSQPALLVREPARMAPLIGPTFCTLTANDSTYRL